VGLKGMCGQSAADFLTTTPLKPQPLLKATCALFA